MQRHLLAFGATALLALAPSPASAQSDIVDTAVNAGSFTTLVAALEAADLVSVLQGEGPFTVFAPTDDAFAKLPDGTVEALLADTEALTRVLTYHVVAGEVTAEQVVGIDAAETVAGIEAPVEMRDDIVYVGGAQVIQPDVMASNGVIHIMGDVMLPPDM